MEVSSRHFGLHVIDAWGFLSVYKALVLLSSNGVLEETLDQGRRKLKLWFEESWNYDFRDKSYIERVLQCCFSSASDTRLLFSYKYIQQYTLILWRKKILFQFLSVQSNLHCSISLCSIQPCVLGLLSTFYRFWVLERNTYERLIHRVVIEWEESEYFLL